MPDLTYQNMVGRPASCLVLLKNQKKKKSYDKHHHEYTYKYQDQFSFPINPEYIWKTPPVLRKKHQQTQIATALVTRRRYRGVSSDDHHNENNNHSKLEKILQDVDMQRDRDGKKKKNNDIGQRRGRWSVDAPWLEVGYQDSLVRLAKWRPNLEEEAKNETKW